MSQVPAARPLTSSLAGRSFVHPVVDYLLVGGGLSLIVIAVIAVRGSFQLSFSGFGENVSLMAPLILLTNSAHFASSTVRLYTKPGATQEMPGLTLLFPIVALALLTLCIFEPESLGGHLQSLQMTWSPFHYAAQAYGLSVMYSMHSGCRLGTVDKKLLRWVCLLPFFLAIIQPTGTGIGWLLPASFLNEPDVTRALLATRQIISILIFATPLLLFAKVWRSASGPMPLISLLVIVTNGVWWAALTYRDAFVWATVFHGVQYLAIVCIFHVRDQRAANSPHGALYHVLRFYGISALLGYGLFNLLPYAYVFAGFGFVESMLLVVAAINIHHFVVDAFIWRLSRGSNRLVVDAAVPLPG